MISVALSERYAYTCNHDSLCIVLRTTTSPCDHSNVANTATWSFQCRLSFSFDLSSSSSINVWIHFSLNSRLNLRHGRSRLVSNIRRHEICVSKYLRIQGLNTRCSESGDDIFCCRCSRKTGCEDVRNVIDSDETFVNRNP